MRVFIEPNDVLFFRDGKPFEAGGDHVARLAFPPSPIPFYGAIRAALIADHYASFDAFANKRGGTESVRPIVGTKDKEGSLTIEDFGLARMTNSGIERLFPIPSDVVKVKDQSTYHILSPETNAVNVLSNMPVYLRLLGTKATSEFLEAASGFLTEEGYKIYLQGQKIAATTVRKHEDVFQPEYRVGIGRNNATRSAEEGRLYSIEFARLQKKSGEEYGFVLTLGGLTGLADSTWKRMLLRLGGESRSALLQAMDYPSVTQSKPVGRMFKIVFLTHAIFKQGWIPDSFIATSNAVLGELGEKTVQLIAAAVPRHVPLGGWDIANNRAKPMRRAVAAGRVYYFDSLDSPPSFRIGNIIHLGEQIQFGLGQAIIGEWDHV